VALPGLWNKAGINWDSVTLGGNAGLWSLNQTFSNDDRNTMNHMLDDVYDAFIERVAKGRNFAPDVVESMAGGRVWTGRQAKQRGLIDEIGGLHEAMDDVARETGVGRAEDLDVTLLPETREPFEDILGFMLGGVQISEYFQLFMGNVLSAGHPAWGITRSPDFALRY
jgi:protease-4